MTDPAVTTHRCDRPPLAIDLERGVPFAERHIGPARAELATMLAAIGAASLDELADAAVPAAIRDTEPVPLHAAARGRPRRRCSPSCARSPPATPSPCR